MFAKKAAHEGEEPIIETFWADPYTQTTYSDENPQNSTIYSSPQVVWNGSHWVPYVFEDHYSVSGYYLLRNAYITAEIYDYYARFYDVNYTEVRLYDERFEIQRWKRNKWDDIGAQSGTPTYAIITNSSGVFLTKSFSSWAGILEVAYALRVASPIKQSVTWASSIVEETEFRIVQKWSGIVGNKVKSEWGEYEISGPTTLNSTWFIFKENEIFKIFGDQRNTGQFSNGRIYINYVLRPTKIDVHVHGMKVDFIFQNSTLYTIPKDGTIKLDPATSTFQGEASLDGYMYKFGDSYPPTDGPYVFTEDPYIMVGQFLYYQYYTYRGYVSFDTSSIPNGVFIASAELRLKTYTDDSGKDFYVRVMGGKSTNLWR